MIDGFGSKDLGDDFLLALHEAGVRVLEYRPQISPWTLRRERLRRLHRKVVVIDARVAFVGGINIIDDMHTPSMCRRASITRCRIEGPLLAPIHASAVDLWTLVDVDPVPAARAGCVDPGACGSAAPAAPPS